MIDAEHVTVPSFAARAIRVCFPPPSRGLPVPLLILFDGQNVFDDEHAPFGGWHADRAACRLGRRRHRPIVVGVEHGGEDRLGELAPWRVHGQAGRAEEFTAWLAHDLVPRLRRRYPIIEGPVGVLVGGASMGGLAALYAHLRWPNVFGGALAMSPSLWVGGRAFVDFIRRVERPAISQIYLDGGLHEAHGSVAHKNHLVREALLERGWDAGRVRALVDPRGRHTESSWRRRLPGALRWFYPDTAPRRHRPAP